MSILDKQKITHITLLCQVLWFRLQGPVAENNFKQKLKNVAKSFLNELENVERERFGVFIDKQEEITDLIVGVMENFYKKVASVEIEHMENIMYLIDLYNESPAKLESMLNEKSK